MSVNESGQIAPIDRGLMDVRAMLGKNVKGLDALLKGFMPPERFCGAILTLCRANPDLTDHTKASRPSLLLSVMRIAQLQLSPDPALGQAWVVPRKGKAEFQLGWKGCLALAYRSPLVRAVRYGVVGPADRFVWRDGRDFVLEHEPSEDGWPTKLGDVRAAWCIIETTRGGEIPRVMYRAEIERHKARGSGSQPAWATDPSPMSLKTVIGDACRRGPFEGETARAFGLDHLGELGKGQPKGEQEFIDVEFEAGANGSAGAPPSVADAFKAAHGEAPDAAPFLDKTAVEALYTEAGQLGVAEQALTDRLAEYGGSESVPSDARETVIRWIHDTAKKQTGKRRERVAGED